MDNRPKIRALLVGINEYESKLINDLNYCISDVEKMETLLHKYYDAEVLKMTTDKQCDLPPSKSGIIEKFQKHLIEPIQEGEIALFYFSGHGGLEWAHSLFINQGETIQVLACHDSYPRSSEGFLADKELRYLIRKVWEKGAETVVICDCCHSGGNTRNAISQKSVKLFGTKPNKARDWSGFYFSQDNNLSNPETLGEKPIGEWLPEGQHIQLGAAEQDQFAFESTDRGGLFTHALVECIQKYKGKISYHFLNQYIRFRVQRTHTQTPLLVPVSSSKNQQLPFRKFLGPPNDILIEPISSLVQFNQGRRCWTVDAGAIYGLTYSDDLGYKLQDENFEEIERVWIDQIAGTHASLKMSPYPNVIMEGTYYLKTPNLLRKMLMVWIDPEVKHSVKKLYDAIVSAKFFIQEVEHMVTAQISIRKAENSSFLIVEDKHGNFDPQYWQTSLTLDEYLLKINWISQWYFIFKLANLQSKIKSHSISIEFSLGEKILDTTLNQSISLSTLDIEKEKIKLKVSNLTKANLFISVFLLNKQLEVKIFEEYEDCTTVKRLPASQTKAALWNIQLNSNIPEVQQYLLILVSEARFEVDYFQQNQIRGKPTEDKAEELRGDWFTLLYPIQFKALNFS